MKNLLLLLLTVLIFSACKKENESPFSESTYKNLASFDDSGKPTNLETPDAISPNLTAFIGSTLPEATDLRKSNSQLLTNPAIADITVTQSSNIYLTFVSQGASTRNAVAFYTYPTGSSPTNPKDVKTFTYVFANAGVGTTLKSGDKVKIGRFEPGTSIGLVLLQGAWDNTRKTLDNNAVHFCSNDVLNPENDPALKKHAVLLNYSNENKILIGFEDVNRTIFNCDHDFNDLIMYATLTP